MYPNEIKDKNITLRHLEPTLKNAIIINRLVHDNASYLNPVFHQMVQAYKTPQGTLACLKYDEECYLRNQMLPYYIFKDDVLVGEITADWHDKEGITENNKSVLILALLVLLSIGIIKLILLFFNNVRCEGSAVIELHLNERHIKFDALIDSGNLAKDPFDSSPVMLIGVNEARKLVDLPDSAEKYDNLLVELKKRIRIIPITRGGIKKILYGIKPDKAFYVKGKCKTEIKITMAIDYDEGVYGGYTGLIPLSALEEIV